MPEERNTLEVIKDILLAHRGKENAITSDEIAKWTNLGDGKTNVRIRRLILATAEKYHLAIASCRDGYFVIKRASEFVEYTRELDSRMAQIERRKNLIVRNYIEEV